MIAFYFWSKLPQTIPTHFSFSGQADSWSQKSLWYMLLVPLLQTVLVIGFGFLYLKPQYTNIPSTLFLITYEKTKRNIAYKLIRNMLVVSLAFVGVFFTYLTFALNYAAFHGSISLMPLVLIVWLVALFAWLIWYNVKVYRTTMKFIADNKSK
jgi:uncharacterized membrane protein